MSKKDYQALARVLFEALVDHHTWYHITQRVADVLAADNPRFDRARFVEACETGTTRGMKAQP